METKQSILQFAIGYRSPNRLSRVFSKQILDAMERYANEKIKKQKEIGNAFIDKLIGDPNKKITQLEVAQIIKRIIK